MDLEAVIDKNFYNDLYTKIKFIDLNDTSVVNDEKICQFIEYSMKQNYHMINSDPLNQSQKILQKRFSLMQILGKPLMKQKKEMVNRVLK